MRIKTFTLMFWLALLVTHLSAQTTGTTTINFHSDIPPECGNSWYEAGVDLVVHDNNGACMYYPGSELYINPGVLKLMFGGISQPIHRIEIDYYNYSDNVPIEFVAYDYGDSFFRETSTEFGAYATFVFDNTDLRYIDVFELVIQQAAITQIRIDYEVDFMVSPQPACPGDTIRFEYHNAFMNLQWDLGDGTIIHDKPYVEHVYTDINEYPVILTVTNFDYSKTNIEKTVSVVGDAVPEVYFDIHGGSEFCPNDEIFIETKAAGTHFKWTFSDGEVIEGKKSLTKKFALAGEKSVELEITNNCGNTATETQYMYIIEDLPANASFDVWPPEVCPTEPIWVNAHFAGNHVWQFGDGTSATGQHVEHVYPELGTYELLHIARNNCGNTDSLTQEVIVRLDEFADPPYVEAAIVNSEYGYYADICPGITLDFKAVSGFQPGVTYEWMFPDGYVTSDLNPQFTFNDEGNFSIQLKGTNNCGATSYAEVYVNVSSGIYPYTEMQFTPDQICPGETVYFWDEAFDKNKYLVYNVVYGDGSADAGITDQTNTPPQVLASHQYMTEGTFPVVFSATNLCGNTETIEGEVIVSADATNEPFYYVESSTDFDPMIPDWSKRRSNSDHEMIVPVSWPTQPDTMNSLINVYFWYGNVDMEAPTSRMPDGMITVNATAAEVAAYIPFDEFSTTVGVMAGWNCSALPYEEPTVYSFPLDDMGAPIDAFNYEPYGSSNILSDAAGEIVLPEWNGYCDPVWNIYGNYSYVNDFNEKVTLSLWENIELGEYKLELIDLETGQHRFYSRGQFYSEGQYIQFMPSEGDCMEMISYSYQFRNRELYMFSYGDVCSIREEMLVSHPLVLDYNPNPDAACPGDPVWFQVVGGSNYLWEMPDGTTTTEAFFSHTFSELGTHQVKLYTENNCGRKDTFYVYAEISDKNKPFAGFHVEMHHFMAGTEMQFRAHDDKSDMGYTYYWSFGDGNEAVGASVSHAYEQPGDYEITLKVTNGCGFEDQKQFVKVFPRPGCDARFVYEYDAVSDSVRFYNKSITEAHNYLWSFGDGKSSKLANPVHKYERNGVYNVCLTVNDTINDCQDKHCQDVVSGEMSCLAEFYYFLDPETNLIEFANNSIGSNLVYNWSFGDGTYSQESDPVHYYDDGWYSVCLSIRDTETGCQSESCLEILVGEDQNNCYVTFDFFVDGNTVEFTSNSETTFTDYFWEFGNGDYDTIPNPVYTYNMGGYYWVCLSAYDANTDCMTDFCTEIFIEGEGGTCNALYSYFVDNESLEVAFTDQSMGDVSEWYWEFGDGSYSTETNPVHTYDYPGVYWTCLYTYDETTGCYSERCKEIVVGEEINCDADFSYVIDHETATVTFNNKSKGENLMYFWDFGNGDFSEQKSPVYNYTQSGYYFVYLMIFDSLSGCMDEAFREFSISIDGQETLQAKFSSFVNPETLTITLTDKSVGNATEWYWTMGDGAYAEGQEVTYTYQHAGLYPVCLFVFDENTGNYDEVCKEIRVGSSDCNIIAGFDYFIDYQSLSISFSNGSLGNANTWFWDFGNGKTSSEKSPKHVYTQPGFYMVTLSASDSTGNCADYFAEFIQLGEVDCKASFNAKVNPETRNVIFENTSKNAAYAYWWFGDGYDSEELNPSRQYQNPGKYWVGVAIADETGMCWDYTEKDIQVGEIACSAEFQTAINGQNLKVQFDNKSLGGSTQLYWGFGDGSTSTANDPTHQYTVPGYYLANLFTYNDANDCMDYYEKFILVGEEGQDCEADFYYQSNATTRLVKFADKSMGENLTYFWDFGDGSTSEDKNPEHTYVENGFYYVCLIVENGQGISNMTCKDVQVGEGCRTDFIYTINHDNLSVKFQDKSFGNPNSWKWDFGDETGVSTEQNPEYTFSEAGHYVVELKTENQVSCKSKFVNIVSVGMDDTDYYAGFTAEEDTANRKPNGYPVDYFGSSKGDAAKVKWKFGSSKKGTYAENETTLRPTFVYTEPGTYEVCLTVSDPNTGKEATSCRMVKVGEEDTGFENGIWTGANLSIHPNPASEQAIISFSLPTSEHITINLLDITGRQIIQLADDNYTADKHQLNWDVSSLNSGVYLIELKSAKGGQTLRMMIK